MAWPHLETLVRDITKHGNLLYSFPQLTMVCSPDHFSGPSHTFLGIPVPRSAGVHSSLRTAGELKYHGTPPSLVHSTSLESCFCSPEETQKRRTPKEVILLGEECAGVRWLWRLRDIPQAKVNPEQKQGAVDSHLSLGFGGAFVIVVDWPKVE